MASKKKKTTNGKRGKAVDTAYAHTDSGPSLPPAETNPLPPAQKAKKVGELSAAMPHNENVPKFYGKDSPKPPEGSHHAPPDPSTLSSTLSETERNAKTGEPAKPGRNANTGELETKRADPEGQSLTTNQGVRIADNQSSLKAGLRGPALLKDFILREKITHFDHERIPERVVHARGSGAHGYFEAYDDLSEITCAAPFKEVGKRTPVFVRFSTVAGERGSKDTARDVRGFAVKFYTDEGIWDLVGNNIPVFFIQDAIKFPDIVHAVKPEPHHAMPQAASAHDTFWDFISLMPETLHTVIWAMSGRGIPRSYRMMQGFGVHTFRFVTREGKSTFVKFHWVPKLGTHSHVWDEAVKISGADPDYHRRDLWEAIEAGAYPEWELGVQLFDEEQAEKFSFDVLDSTKIIPEELVPLRMIGKLVLNRNPDNFFAETEQVAFCTAHIIPGIDFTNDPLLAGRIHSYVDTQLIRLGGPNFHEIPINAPLVEVQNNQRDGYHRQTIHRGRVSYEPNSLGGGCPFQAGEGGFMSFPEPVEGSEVRGKPEKFAEHYNQVTLFYRSQAPDEQRHIMEAFAFELSKVTVPAIRERMISHLLNVDAGLAEGVAKRLGMGKLPPPAPRFGTEFKPEIERSDYLSLKARPGDGSLVSLKIAVMADQGADQDAIDAVAGPLIQAGAMLRLVGPHVGLVPGKTAADALDLDASFENSPSVLFDAIILPHGKGAVEALKVNGYALEFIRDAYRHGKPILYNDDSKALLVAAGISEDLFDEGVVYLKDTTETALAPWRKALVTRRFHQREAAPPRI